MPIKKAVNVFKTTGSFSGILIALLVLASCSSEIPVSSKLMCPTIFIPKNTDTLIRYTNPEEGGGRDITDIQYQAGVGYLSGSCTIDPDKIVMNFPILIEMRKGPANTTNEATIRVFLAVMNQKRERLTQTSIPYKIEFKGNNPIAVVNDPITIDIPKRPDQQGNQFVVYMGIEMSEAEINYNREQYKSN